ncbi:MAG: polyprenyl synthetase family protein [Thermoanaerobaculia bacterium]
MTQPTPLARKAAPSAALLGQRMLSLVGDKLMATEALFRRELSSDVPFIADAGRYISEGGGKRVRPALLLLCARLLGHDSAEEVTYAAVVEFIHSATLIHDDIIDLAPLRRGRPTAQTLWGNHKTVLLGDWIYTKAMQLALEHGRVEVIRRLCAATLAMTEGELLVLDRLGAPDLSRDEYYQIIDRKTALLFAAACSIPSLIEPVRPEAGAALERFGRQLGLCFQVVDDLLDFTARESDLGKPVLSDLREGKLTLPLLLLLPRVPAGDRTKVETVLADRAFERVAAEEILELVAREGTLAEAESLAEAHAEAARRELAYFPPSETRDILELAPDFVLHRNS